VRRALVLVALASACLAGQLQAAVDPRLATRLDAATAGEVQKLVDDASAHGLPTAPLVSKALEGAAKHASPERIVAAVRAQSAAMGEARAALGDTSSASEIVAGAGALMAGVPRDSLTRLRVLRPHQPLVVPLVVMADLVTRSVPAGAAAQAVLIASRARVRDSDLLDLRKRIENDIAGGALPAEAAIVRTRDLRPPAAQDPRTGRTNGGPP
jgi:hypothetical protein